MCGPACQVTRPPINHDLGNLADLIECLGFVDNFRPAIAIKRKLASMPTARSLFHDATNAVWIGGALHPVQDHFCDSELAQDAFTPGFEIQGIGQAFSMFAALDCRHVSKFGLGIPNQRFRIRGWDRPQPGHLAFAELAQSIGFHGQNRGHGGIKFDL